MQNKITVVWHAQIEGQGVYDSTEMLRNMLDLYDCAHYGAWFSMPENIEGAVVVIHGGRELGREDKLNEDIKKLKWVILILLGDEENRFGIEHIEHPHKKIWIQEPMPGRHDFADRFMINGYGHDRHRHIFPTKKDLDWCFGGQETHERRRACVDALRKIPWGGVMILTKGYYQGVSMPEYVRLLCRSRVVFCPSGPFSPDAARPWDALECSSIPILDDLSPTRKEPGFWKYLLGEHPLPVVERWEDGQQKLHEIISGGWEARSIQCQAWWLLYKDSFGSWLQEDLKDLGVECTKNS